MRTKIYFLLLLMSVYLEMLRHRAFYENAWFLVNNPKSISSLVMGGPVWSKLQVFRREAPFQLAR